MYNPSSDLLKDVRAAFVARGTSLSAFCRDKGLHRPNVSSALSGKWKGDKAMAVAAFVAAAAGIEGRE